MVLVVRGSRTLCREPIAGCAPCRATPPARISGDTSTCMEMNLFRDICEPPKGCGSHSGEQNPPRYCHLLTGLPKQRGQAELLSGDMVRGRGEKSHADIPSVRTKPHQGDPRQGAKTHPCPSHMGTPLLPSLLPPPADATRPLLCQLLFFFLKQPILNPSCIAVNISDYLLLCFLWNLLSLCFLWIPNDNFSLMIFLF